MNYQMIKNEEDDIKITEDNISITETNINYNIIIYNIYFWFNVLFFDT